MTRPGSLLSGRYELGAVLGRGGMGTVYRASDRLLGRAVAVKVLAPALAEDPTFVARFRREALAVASIDDRHVVPVYDLATDGDCRFIVMALVEGRDLAQTLRGRGRLGADEVVRIGREIAAALSAAHAVGIVHRDIKPANVMLEPDGGVRVLDFGVARAVDRTALTRASTIIGSAAYLAPELAAGAKADARSDLYALGCVLYELLTGAPPFRGDSLQAVINQHATRVPGSLRDAGVRASPGLTQLIAALLAKDPARRPQTAAAVASRLDHAAGTAPAATLVWRPSRRRGSASVRAVALGASTLAAAVAVVAVLAAPGGSARAPARVAGTVAKQQVRPARVAAARRAGTRRRPTLVRTTASAPPLRQPDRVRRAYGTPGSWSTLVARYCRVGELPDGVCGHVERVIHRLATRPQPDGPTAAGEARRGQGWARGGQGQGNPGDGWGSGNHGDGHGGGNHGDGQGGGSQGDGS